MGELASADAFGPTLTHLVGTPTVVSIAPLPRSSAIGLRVAGAGLDRVAAVERISGLPLPAQPNTVTGDRRRWFWLGPREWLLMDSDDLTAVSVQLTEALRDVTHVVSPLGPSLASIAVDGPEAETLIASGCPLDLESQAFPAGTCARSLLGKARVLFHRREAGFHLHVDISLCRYVAEWLTDAAIPPMAKSGLCRKLPEWTGWVQEDGLVHPASE